MVGSFNGSIGGIGIAHGIQRLSQLFSEEDSSGGLLGLTQAGLKHRNRTLRLLQVQANAGIGHGFIGMNVFARDGRGDSCQCPDRVALAVQCKAQASPCLGLLWLLQENSLKHADRSIDVPEFGEQVSHLISDSQVFRGHCERLLEALKWRGSSADRSSGGA